MSDILFEEKSGIGFISLNRAKALNALTHDMIKALTQNLVKWQGDESIKAVLIQSTSDKAFCAGGDVRWLYERGRAGDDAQLDFFWDEYRLNYLISQYAKPYISLLNGITMGGGVGISLHGSHPIATENFSFAMPETGIGFFPDIGGSYLLSHCHGKIGWYLGLTGAHIGWQEAIDAGLIKYTLESGDQAQFIKALCELDWTDDAHADVGKLTRQFKMQAGRSSLADHQDAIECGFSQDSVPGILAVLEERDDEWSQKVVKNLNKKSPLSLCLTLEQLNRASQMDLAQALIMEYRMVSHLMTQHDFYEGVRALLVDKDKNPHWQPSSLAGVNEDLVQAYFKSQQRELELV